MVIISQLLNHAGEVKFVLLLLVDFLRYVIKQDGQPLVRLCTVMEHISIKSIFLFGAIQ